MECPDFISANTAYADWQHIMTGSLPGGENQKANHHCEATDQDLRRRSWRAYIGRVPLVPHKEDVPSDPKHSVAEDMPSRTKLIPNLVKKYAVSEMERDIRANMKPQKHCPAALFGATSCFEDATDRSREHRGAAEIRAERTAANITQEHRARRNLEGDRPRECGDAELRSDLIQDSQRMASTACVYPKAPGGVGRKHRVKRSKNREYFDEEALLDELTLRIRCGVKTAQARQSINLKSAW